MYKKPFKNALKNFKFILIIPDMIMLLFTFVFGWLFIKLSGMYSFFKGIDLVSISQEQLFELLKNYFSNNYISLIVYGVLFFVLNFMVGASFIAFKYKLITKVINRTKIKFFQAWKESMKFIWKVILFRVILFIVGIIVISFLMLFFSVFLVFDLKLLGGVLSFLLFFLIIFLLQIFWYFVYPFMFLNNRNVINSLKNSFYSVKNNFGYVFVIWFFSLLLIFVTSFIIGVLDNLSGFVGVLSFVYVFMRFIINLFIGVYVELVKFYAYKLKH
jgi:hypothetical protein